MNENREYKSDVFSMLMENKSYALEVYNALNHSDYKNPEEVEIIRLERGISLSIRNDASFLIDMNMSFYEHQSTYNPNMPLRSVIYYINALEDWLRRKNLDLFSRRRIQLPTPHFVVFYNGTEKRPEYEEMKLSEAFCHKTDEPGFEEGVGQGRLQILTEQVCSKLKKGKTPEEIADALEEPVENIQKICRIAEQYAPEYPVEEVCRALMN